MQLDLLCVCMCLTKQHSTEKGHNKRISKELNTVSVLYDPLSFKPQYARADESSLATYVINALCYRHQPHQGYHRLLSPVTEVTAGALKYHTPSQHLMHNENQPRG